MGEEAGITAELWATEDDEAEEETEVFDAPTEALALAETETDAETPLEAADDAFELTLETTEEA